jgi:hypothetical protein
MIFLLSEYHARRNCPGYLESGELARMIHPLDAPSNADFFLPVSKARKERFGVTARYGWRNA